jgi:hypothetical protein
MKEVFNRVFVSNGATVEAMSESERSDYYIIYCAKHPYHKKEVGYTGCCPSVGHVEEDIAKRDGYCALNLIDHDRAEYVNQKAIDRGMKMAAIKHLEGKKVAFVCNQGISRSPTMAMMLVYYITGKKNSFHSVIRWMETVYPEYNPKQGTLAVANRVFRKLL